MKLINYDNIILRVQYCKIKSFKRYVSTFLNFQFKINSKNKFGKNYMYNLYYSQVENEEMKNKDDFSVVLQTFTENLSLPVNRFNKTDLTYLGADCFHLSQKGYAKGKNTITC